MAYSYIKYAGNGSTVNYTFPFPCISTAHVKVYLNGVAATGYTFLNTNTVTLATAVPATTEIEIRRETPKDSPIVNFTDGSVLLEADLDLMVMFNLYVSQETWDRSDVVIAKSELAITAAAQAKAYAERAFTYERLSNDHNDNANDADDRAKAYKELAAGYANATKASATLTESARSQVAGNRIYVESALNDVLITKGLIDSKAQLASAMLATSQAAVTQAQSVGSSALATAQAAAQTASAFVANTEILTAEKVAAVAARDAAVVSKNAAAASQVSAATSAITATTQAGVATTQAETAATQAGVATTQASAASTSATAAAASKTATDAAAGTAAAQASTATAQASTATTQAGIATTQAGLASASATAASTSTSAASASATAAASARAAADTAAAATAAQVSVATTQANTATTQAGTATTQAGIATAQASGAATQATAAGNSATAAASAKTGAETARDAAQGYASSIDVSQKANLASPTFTGTVSGITAAMVGAVAGSGTSTGSNTGDETATTIRTKLGVTTLTGSNTGDQTSVTGNAGTATALSAGADRTKLDSLTASSSGSVVSLSGVTTTYVNQTILYNITDFDSFSTYAVSVSAGSVARTADAISFTAPATAGNITLTVTTNSVARAITLTVLAAGVAAPSITSPANAATGVFGPSLTLTSSAFAFLGVSDTHLNSDWQLATDAGFATIVQSTSADAVNKTSWSTTVAAGTTYFARVRHRGTANGVSAYSATLTFSTAASFNSFIATPAATPAAFGDAFEGGFYTGMIFNELVQSSTSTVIGTGSKEFTVADMVATPLVYSGQTLEVRSRANPANKMIGTVTGASGTTLTVNVSSVGGSGTFTDWSVMARYRLIVAPKATGENASGLAYKNIAGPVPAACGTLTEGRKATLAMVAAGNSAIYPAANWCANLSIASRTDWYLPARDELELCWRNLKPTADAYSPTLPRPTNAASPNYTNLGSIGGTADTQGLNDNSAPAGSAYTADSPAQVASGKNFRTGEAEAFTYTNVRYWSATIISDATAWTQLWWTAYPGNQYPTAMESLMYVRAVRRSII